MAGGERKGAGRGVIAARVALALVPLALAGVAIGVARGRADEMRALERLLAGTGLEARQPEVVAVLRADPDPVRARLGVARALLAESFDLRSFQALPARQAIEEISQIGPRLELARATAAEVLARRPAAWEAAMIVGGATYRLRSMRGDRTLAADRGDWEGPLLAALALAPLEAEPRRLLALAYLELWDRLPAGERERVTSLLREAFADPATFSVALDIWLDIAGDRDTAFSLVPDRVAAWSTLQAIYASRRDWDGWIAAEERREQALRAFAAATIEDLRERVRGGDAAGVRQRAIPLLAALPTDGQWRSEVEQVVRLLPPSGGTYGYAALCSAWTHWAVDGLVFGTHSLAPDVVQRLAAGAEDASAPVQALAQLAGGNLVAAETIERRGASLNTEEWAPYAIAKARALIERNELDQARALLAGLHPAWRGSGAAAAVRDAVARAQAGSRPPAVPAGLRRPAVDEDEAGMWRVGERRWWAELDLAAEARGLSIAVEKVSARGAVVRVSIDGDRAALLVARPGQALEVPRRLPAGVHLVELRLQVGGGVTPGRLSVRREGEEDVQRWEEEALSVVR